MARSFPCPNCRAELTIPPAGGSVTCDGCGRVITATRRPKPEAPPPPPPPAEEELVEIEPEEEPVEIEPVAEDAAAPAAAPKKKKKKRKKAPPPPAPGRMAARLAAIWSELKVRVRRRPVPWAVGGGVVGLLLLTGLVVLLWPSGRRESDDEPNQLYVVRRGGAPLNSFEAVPWAVPPGGAEEKRLPDRIHVAPNESDTVYVAHGRYVSGRLVPDPGEFRVDTKVMLVAGRYDPETGAAVGAPEELPAGKGTAMFIPLHRPKVPEMPAVAIAPDGRIAYRSGGQVLVRPAAGGAPTPAAAVNAADGRWLGWGAGSHLLIGGNQSFVGWDTAAGKELFRYGKGHGHTGDTYHPLAVSPAGNWVVVGVNGKYLEVQDTATGECRGRFGGLGGWVMGSVSPDGRWFVAARHGEDAAGRGVYWWDMTTGDLRGSAPLWSEQPAMWPKRFHWAGSDAVIALPTNAVFDLKAGVALRTFPDGVVLAQGDRVWRGKGPLTAGPLPPPPPGSLAYGPQTPLRVEAECGTRRRNQEAIATLGAILQDRGHKLGRGGWTVKVWADQTEGGRSIEFGSTSVRVPAFRGKVALLDPAGVVAAEFDHKGDFPAGSSQYNRGSKVLLGGVGTTTETKFDFGSRDPVEAMAAEAWEQYLFGLERTGVPRGVWKGADDKYAPLPVEAGP